MKKTVKKEFIFCIFFVVQIAAANDKYISVYKSSKNQRCWASNNNLVVETPLLRYIQQNFFHQTSLSVVKCVGSNKGACVVRTSEFMWLVNVYSKADHCYSMRNFDLIPDDSRKISCQINSRNKFKKFLMDHSSKVIEEAKDKNINLSRKNLFGAVCVRHQNIGTCLIEGAKPVSHDGEEEVEVPNSNGQWSIEIDIDEKAPENWTYDNARIHFVLHENPHSLCDDM